MLNGPNNTPIGELIQEPGLAARGRAYKIGEPVEYDSIYGYKKLRVPVYAVDTTNGTLGSCVGWIKQEPMADEHGKLVGFTYYTKESWRNQGQLRFYPSPEALLAAYLMPVYAGEVIDPNATSSDVQDNEPDMGAEADHQPVDDAMLSTATTEG